MLEAGNNLLVAHRRLFADEEPRYFLGQVVEYSEGLVKVGGYTFVRDVSEGTFAKKNDLRIKIFALASPGLIVYQLPDAVDVESARFETMEGESFLTDGRSLRINMSENMHHCALV